MRTEIENTRLVHTSHLGDIARRTKLQTGRLFRTAILVLLLASLWAAGCGPAPPTEQFTSQPSPSPTATPIPIPTEKYQSPGDYINSIVVDNYKRWFTVHIPPGYQPGVPLPLVINLHGYTGTMFQQEEMSQMNAKADQESFVAVHPQAIGDPPSWWGPLPGLPGQADKDFFVELLAHLQREISIDPARIYATGFSNGGTMAHALGCVMSHTFAAIAPVAGGHTDFTNCDVERPVSVLVIHGTMDTVIPYHGRGDEVPPVHLWLEAWAERNGCDPAPSVEQQYDTLKIETWENCDEDVVVMLDSRIGGDHIWPGSEAGTQREGFSSNINATDVIWEFFAAHPRPPAPQKSEGHRAKN
jgi:polyhydroxybutyrate depolymerase